MEPRGQSLSEPFIRPLSWEVDGLSQSVRMQRQASIREKLSEMGFPPASIDHTLLIHNVTDIHDALQLLGNEDFSCSICSRSSFELETRNKEICGICYEDIQTLETLSCGHRFCLDCLRNYAEAAVIDGKVMNIKCPQSSCPSELEKIEELLSPEMQVKFQRFRKNQLINQDPDVRWCPTPDCENVLKGGSVASPKLTCGKCRMEVCFRCGEQWHGRKTCGQAADSTYETWAKGKNIQHCPVCRRRIEKEDGCNHMQCPACSYQWCWLCRGRYTDMHYSALNPFGCPGLQSAEHTLDRWPWYKRWLLRLCVLCIFPLVLIFGVPVVFTYKAMELMEDTCYSNSAFGSCLKYCMLLPFIFALGVVCTPFVIVLSCPPLLCFLFVNCLIGLKFQLRILATRLRNTEARTVLV